MKYALGVFVLFPLLLAMPLMLTMSGTAVTPAWFIHAPTMFVYALVVSAVILITGEFKTKIRVANALFSKKYKISDEDTERGIRLLELLKISVIYTAVFFTIASTIVMMADLDNYDMLGPMIAIMLLIPMYAAMINLVLIIPAIHILKTRRNEEKAAHINERQVTNKLLELCYKQGITPEEILGAKEINFK
ncbi:MAG: hypothetical protein FWF80_01590 [Defluviitaleaceae bacterium]|nr:hypothetical protein [Defluviitaleaceae bacterium]